MSYRPTADLEPEAKKINMKGIFCRTGASMREAVTIVIAFLALSQMASTVEGKSVNG